jgi:hypothetical protein
VASNGSRLSVCCAVGGPRDVVFSSLELLRPRAAQIVVAVDSRADPEEVAMYGTLADDLFRFEFEGFVERFLSWLHARCTGEWILRLDGDEVVGESLLAELDGLVAARDVAQYWLQRHHLYPDHAHWLREWPWWPDLPVRLYRNDPLLWTPGICHTSVTERFPARLVHDPCLYHVEAIVLSAEERAEKLSRYLALDTALIVGHSEEFQTRQKFPERYPGLATAAVPDRDAARIADALESRALDAPPRYAGLATRAEIDGFWPERTLDEDSYRGAVRVLDPPETLRPGQRACLRLAVRNDGPELWPGGPERRPLVRVGQRWLDGNGSPSAEPEGRGDLPAPLQPGMESIVPIEIAVPAAPGRYLLELDLVHEFVRWFDRPTRVSVSVVAAPRRGRRRRKRTGAELLLVVPTFGRSDELESLLGDVDRERELVDILVVDNAGAHVPLAGEDVVRAGVNGGWLESCNLGLGHARARGSRAAVLLNDDTRLSAGFFAGLVRAWEETRAGLVAPAYDDFWPHQRVAFSGPAAEYVPSAAHRRVPFVDGTCMFVPMTVYRAVGPLDRGHFGRHGWGADVDYALRVRLAGLGVYMTELAYLNHRRGTTARSLDPAWEPKAHAEMGEGMRAKWGDDWESLIAPEATGPPRTSPA